MKLTELTVGDVVVLVPEGRLDSATSPALGTRLDALAGTPDHRLVLDLAGVDFVSSAGLRVILSATKRARAARSLMVLCAVRPPVREVLDISGFTTLLTIHPGRDSALLALAP